MRESKKPLRPVKGHRQRFPWWAKYLWVITVGFVLGMQIDKMITSHQHFMNFDDHHQLLLLKQQEVPIILSSEKRNNYIISTNNSKSRTTTRKQAKIALVMRCMDPISTFTLNRILQVASILQRDDEFLNYDFHLIIDQTRVALTSSESLKSFFAGKNVSSHIEPPKVFSVSERFVLDEFPELEKGYVPGPLVDGTKGKCCAMPLMWQFLSPTFITFVHHNQQYENYWVFEDDVWTVGKYTLIDLFRHWDERLEGKQVGLIGNKVTYGRMPYNRMQKEKFTEGFHEIIKGMKATHTIKNNPLEIYNLTRSKVWNSWDETTLPPWTCMSDAVYRHSREFSNFMYDNISNNTYAYAECFQMPIAWAGGFNITDLTALSNEEQGLVGWHNMNRKRNHSYALQLLHSHQPKVSTLVYHCKDTRPKGGSAKIIKQLEKEKKKRQKQK